MHGLPLKMRFRRSKLYISALLPLGLGFFVGILSAIMGIGGGFVMIPAMIYMLGMPTSVVPGTSLFQIIFVAASVTILQATNNRTVDVGTGEALQVPSLLGVGARGPWMHDGCASTLKERFDPACGGDAHGDTSRLDEEEIDSLVRFLASL